MLTHQFASHINWAGSTSGGYRSFSRDHRGSSPRTTSMIALSADRHFLGDDEKWNPEQLLVTAASSCLMLTFLAHASLANQDVIGYSDGAVGLMPDDASPMRVTAIRLSPRITAAPTADLQVLAELLERSHRECFIANSLTTATTVYPLIGHVDGAARAGEPGAGAAAEATP